MPAGSLSFVQNWPTAFIAEAGVDRYLVIHMKAAGLASGQWSAVYLGTGALAQVGTYGNQGDAMSGCNVHYNTLAT